MVCVCEYERNSLGTMSIVHQGYDNVKEILEVECPYSIRGMKEILKFKPEF